MKLEKLIGMFVFYDEGGGYFRTGEIKMAFENSVLVQFDVVTRPPHPVSFPMVLVEVDQLTAFVEDGIDTGRSWGFFETREQLDAYIAHLKTPRPEPEHDPAISKRRH
jgi:hypothetical protein